MFSILGKGLILAGMTMLGFQYAGRLRKRVSCLKEFLKAVECLERELAFALLPVESLLDRLREGASGPAKAFFASCVEKFERRGEERLEEIWQAQLEETPLPIQAEDKLLLREVGGVLGKYDGDSQRLALQRIQGRLGESIQKAKEESERMGKLYGTLGVTVGLFCIILL